MSTYGIFNLLKLNNRYVNLVRSAYQDCVLVECDAN